MTARPEAGLGLGFGFEESGWILERWRMQQEQDLYQSEVERVGGVEAKDQVPA